jgi:rubrerythrin
MATNKTGDMVRIHDLLYQALETEIGGVNVYTAALTCATNEDLAKEWQSYLDETTTHRQVLLTVFEELGLDPDKPVPSREVVKHQPLNVWSWRRRKIIKTGSSLASSRRSLKAKKRRF